MEGYQMLRQTKDDGSAWRSGNLNGMKSGRMEKPLISNRLPSHIHPKFIRGYDSNTGTAACGHALFGLTVVEDLGLTDAATCHASWARLAHWLLIARVFIIVQRYSGF